MEYWQSERNLGIPKHVKKRQVIISTRFYSKSLIEDSDTKKSYSLFHFPRQPLNPLLIAQLELIIQGYRSTLRYNSIKPILHSAQSPAGFQILMLAEKYTLRQMVESRKGITQFEARYFLAEIYFALNFLRSKQMVLEHFSCADVGLDQTIRPSLDFMVFLRLPNSEKTFSKYLSSSLEYQLCPYPDYFDSWNMGLCLYEMLEGKPLINSSKKKEYVQNGNIKFTKNLTPECQNLIRLFLHPDLKKRMQIHALFQHPWFKNGEPIAQILPKTVIHCPPSIRFRQQSRLLSEDLSDNFLLNQQDSVLLQNLTSQHNVIIKSERRLDKQFAQMGPKTLKEFLNNNSGEADYRIHVQEHSDISAVFGYGYRMNNGVLGFFFNDRTLLLKIPEKNYYYFDENWELRIIKQQKIPQQNDLRKKYYILQAYIKSVMQYETRSSKPSRHSFLNLIYIKQYIKTNNAKLFLLSNEVVQAQFVDRTQIIATRNASYFDQRKFEWREVKPDDSVDILTREKYTKELARKLMGWGSTWAELVAGEIEEDFEVDT